MDALDLFSEDLDRPLTAKSPPGSASSRRSGGQLGKHSRRSTPHTPSTGRSRVLAVDEVDIEKEGKVAEPVEDGKQDHDDGAGHKERDEDDVESPGPRTTCPWWPSSSSATRRTRRRRPPRRPAASATPASSTPRASAATSTRRGSTRSASGARTGPRARSGCLIPC